jgi:glycosyltransferase involved in cell wall biosynthesis
MKVFITLEHRFNRTPDGAVWTVVACPYSFWQRYLEVFDHVRVVARVREVSSVPSHWLRADGVGVSFEAVPYYIGPWQFWLKRKQVIQVVRNAVAREDAVIVRLSSTIGSYLLPKLYQTGHPYGAEVVGDPYDVFAPNSIKHPLRPFFRWWFPRQLKDQCARACAALYVTKEALQRRYPCPNYSVGVSDVDLPPKAFVASPRSLHPFTGPIHLVLVGSLAQLYKAPDVLIEAVSVCVKEGLDLKLTLIGDGQYRAALESLAREKGLETRIRFLGQLTAGDAIREQLNYADLFVLPSHQEGLPRAMVEAMARGLPCIGSSVGGIPELLPSEDLVPPGDVAALANKIREVATDPERMARMSARNLEKAKEYRDELLQDQRIAFYRYVREQTETWIASHKEERK